EYVKGPRVEAFEREFAAYCGVAHGVGTSSGTTALELLYRAYGIGPGDEVIVPANTSIATAMAVSNAGATPVVVDVDARTANMDPNCVEQAITSKTRAIVPVHLFGRPAAISEIVEVARRRKLLVIEDASQAHGARYDGKRVGSFGDAAAFSLHPSKVLNAYGDAGIVVTNDARIAQVVRELRDIGQVARYVHHRVGTNARLDEIQAAMLSVKLRRLDTWIDRRRAVAERYARRFAGTKVVAQAFSDREFCVFHLYVVQLANRDAVCAALDRAEIDWGIHYPTPIQYQRAYRQAAIFTHPTPVADALSHRILSIPMFAELTPEEVDRVADVVLDAAD
ncbi:MAG: DegT/DnrJ/EryC1/StrS family aminotransferase, partial [Polyangiaceae bacterium]